VDSASQVTGEPFHLQARVAHGGMATIYAAVHRGERVAVKLLHPHLAEDAQIRKMFLHEANLASRIVHDNVVRVLDHGEHTAHGAYIVMEYVDGGDLSGLLKAASKQRRALPPRVVARVVVDLCHGLEVAHRLVDDDGEPLNLIHRDVSPHNVMIGIDGVARLTDFGIAKSDERYTMTRPGQLKGKLSYMAPEQLAHEDGLDGRVDVFAAGVVLWEALLGRRLFKADDEISIINKVLLERAPGPSEYDPALAPFDAVLERALARERDERFGSAAELADAIERATEALGGLAARDEVGAVVTDLLAELLAERAQKIERASMTPSGIRAGTPDPSQSTTASASTSARRPATLWALLVLLLFGAAGVGAGVTYMTRDDPAPAVTEETSREPAVPAPVERATDEPPEAPVVAAPVDADEPDPVDAPSAAEPEPPEAAGRRPPRRRARRGQSAARVEREAVTEPPAAAPPPAPAEPAAREGSTPADDLYPNPFRD